MKQFKVGDVVREKPQKMTVQSVNSDGVVNCQWFDDDGVLYGGEFMADSLEPVPEVDQ